MQFVNVLGTRGLVRDETENHLIVTMEAGSTIKIDKGIHVKYLRRDRRRQWQNALLVKLGISG